MFADTDTVQSVRPTDGHGCSNGCKIQLVLRFFDSADQKQSGSKSLTAETSRCYATIQAPSQFIKCHRDLMQQQLNQMPKSDLMFRTRIAEIKDRTSTLCLRSSSEWPWRSTTIKATWTCVICKSHILSRKRSRSWWQKTCVQILCLLFLQLRENLTNSIGWGHISGSLNK